MKPINETFRHREAFEYYFSLGSNRSSVAVGQQFGVSTRAVEQWSVDFEWQRRIAEREARMAAALSRKNENACITMKARHLALVQKLQTLIEFEIDRRALHPTISDFLHLAVYEKDLLNPESAHAKSMGLFDWLAEAMKSPKQNSFTGNPQSSSPSQ